MVLGQITSSQINLVEMLNRQFSPLYADQAPRRPTIRLDMTTQREEMGYMKPVALARDWGALSRQRGLEGIGRTAEEGDFLGRIEEYRDARERIAQLGLRIYQLNEREFNVGLMPRSRVRADFPLRGPMEIFI